MFARFLFSRRWWLWASLLIFLPEWGGAQSREYEIKAAFLLNFTQFVEWPSSAFPKTDGSLCIGVLGDDPFGSSLDQVVQGETAQDHKLIVRHARKIEDLKECQMIFICKNETRHIPEILAQIGARPVVTVSDVAGFAKRGGTIDFYRDQNKLRFEINPLSAKERGLKISSQLLALGKIVE